MLPTLWFRNTGHGGRMTQNQSLKDASGQYAGVIVATDTALGDYFLQCEGSAELLFTENETNNAAAVRHA